jgi:hypothetical protein
MTPGELQTLRERLGWSAEEAAARLDMSYRSYRYTEEGTNAHGKPLVEVPLTVELAMLAYELAADIQVSAVTPKRLADFCHAVFRPGRSPGKTFRSRPGRPRTLHRSNR